MLILPPAHERRAGSGPGLSRRERRLVAAVGALAAALVVVVVISLLSSGPSSGHGCVHATFPGPVGAEEVSRCGAAARSLCASVGTPSGYTGEAGRTIAVECRRAGLPVGG